MPPFIFADFVVASREWITANPVHVAVAVTIAFLVGCELCLAIARIMAGYKEQRVRRAIAAEIEDQRRLAPIVRFSDHRSLVKRS